MKLLKFTVALPARIDIELLEPGLTVAVDPSGAVNLAFTALASLANKVN